MRDLYQIFTEGRIEMEKNLQKGLQALEEARLAILEKHLENGVRFLGIDGVVIGESVTIGEGTVIEPGVVLLGDTVIGSGCTLTSGSRVEDCTIGSETVINASQCYRSRIGSGVSIGPFSHIRPDSDIADHVHIGDFVEVKNSHIGVGTAVAHLTYVGDSDVGKKVNFGCGTVTTNYDGFKKYRCTIGDESFIGCNTNLVAPVRVGKGSYIAAGATITKDVPEDALAVARVQQENKDGWAARRRKMHGK